MKRVLAVATCGVASLAAQAGFLTDDGGMADSGIKIGDRLTLHPYVSFRYTYDSNVDSGKENSHSSSWSINPGLTLDFNNEGKSIKINGAVYYNGSIYSSDHSERLSNSGFGESLSLSWANERGWSASVSESFCKTLADDDMRFDDGKGLYREHLDLSVNGSLQKRLGERLHVGVNGGFSGIDYENDLDCYAPLYGWSRWTAGANIGWTFTQWTDVFISGYCNGDFQENENYLGGEFGNYYRGNRVDGKSFGYGVHVGVGSSMTEHLRYSISGGWSGYEYGDVKTSNGFTYNGTLSWQMSETWNMSAGISGSFNPSERRYGSSERNDAFSWGISHSMVRGKMSVYLNAMYNRTQSETVEFSGSDTTRDVLTISLGASYSLSRYISLFLNGGYQRSWEEGGEIDDEYDFKRFQVSTGFSLRY